MGHEAVVVVLLPLVFLLLLPKPSSSSWCEKEPLLSKETVAAASYSFYFSLHEHYWRRDATKQKVAIL